MLTCVAEHRYVSDDPLELSGRHPYGALVLRVWDSEMLRFDVHELEVEVRYPILSRGLEHQGQRV